MRRYDADRGSGCWGVLPAGAASSCGDRLHWGRRDLPASPDQGIRDLQQFITDHFYTCTPEILAGLGQMYVADDRFRKNIDMAGGEGTAAFVAQAIAAYCGK